MSKENLIYTKSIALGLVFSNVVFFFPPSPLLTLYNFQLEFSHLEYGNGL